jgi:hypothetical protein
VDILEREDRRLARRQGLYERAHPDNELRLERSGIGRGARTPTQSRLDPQQLRDYRLDLGVVGPDQLAERCTELRPGDGSGFRPSQPTHGPEDLDEGGITRHLRMGLAPPLEPLDTGRQVVAELHLEARFPDPRLAHDGRDLPPPLAECIDAPFQHPELAVAPDHRRREPGNPVPPTLSRADSLDPVGGDRTVEALEREAVEALDVNERPNKAVGVRAEYNAGGNGLKASSEGADLTSDKKLGRRLGDGDRVAGGDSDPELEANTILLLEHRVQLGEAFLHGHSGPDRSLGVILVDQWMPAKTRESALSRAAWEKLVNDRVIPSKGLPLVTMKLAWSPPRVLARVAAAAALNVLCVDG